MAGDSLWRFRTFDSNPQKRSKRRRGWASPFKIAEGAGSARPPTHAGAIRGRSGRRTQGRNDRRATKERWPERTRRPPPTRRREWPRGAIGVRGTSRQSRPSRPSDRPTNHLRASDGATRARCPFQLIPRLVGARGTSSARGVPQRSIPGRLGWPLFWRQPCDARSKLDSRFQKQRRNASSIQAHRGFLPTRLELHGFLPLPSARLR